MVPALSLFGLLLRYQQQLVSHLKPGDQLINPTLYWPLHSKGQLASSKWRMLETERDRPGCPCDLIFYRTLLLMQVNLRTFRGRVPGRGSGGVSPGRLSTQGLFPCPVVPPRIAMAPRASRGREQPDTAPEPYGLSFFLGGKGSRSWSLEEAVGAWR